MPGHVFIVPGDVRRLACDAWLVPCSRRATPHRFRPPHWPDDFPWFTPPDDDQDWWLSGHTHSLAIARTADRMARS